MDEIQKRAKRYWRHKYLFRVLDIIVLVSSLALIQFAGISAQLKNFSFSLSDNFYIALWIYLILLSLAYFIVTSPLNFYEGFALEHAFSLSNQTLMSWIKDEVKKSIIFFFTLSFLIEIFYAIWKNCEANWWLIASLVWTAFSIILAKIFPVLVIPLFYKCKVLGSDKLRNRILGLANRLNIKVLDIFEIEFSSKTKKSNAAIVGWGGTRRIILADNLINEFTVDEIEVVVAHEMAHYKLNHIWKLLTLSALSTTLFFYILSLMAVGLAFTLGAKDQFDIAIFPTICLLFTLYGLIITPIQNGISRKLEHDADRLALKATRLKDSFVSLMERLAEKNLSDKDPNALVAFLFYDHPPIVKRVEMANEILA